MNTVLQGDALQVLRTLPSESVQCCITSPPYYGLRQYLPDTSPDKELEIGLEETPFAYVAKLVAVFREIRRVLKPAGTLWLNLGDTYANDQKWGGNSSGKHQKALHTMTRPTRWTGLPGKNLIGIPWRVAFALQDDGWILRQEIIWEKPNAMPDPTDDRPTRSHEQIFLFSKNARYYYDGEAIAEPSVRPGDIQTFGGNKGRAYTPAATDPNYRYGKEQWGRTIQCGETRHKRSVWSVPTRIYAEAHFATFPPKLIEPCILAGSRPGDVVLDCFMGAGTTALVALQYHRQYIGIELNPDYIALINKRVATYQPHMWEGEVAG